MNREEEIRKAIDKTFPYNNKGRCYEQALGASGFELGAKWADENPISIWHDASEEPTGYPIICQDENRYFWIQYNQYDWECYIEETKLIQWAYINDLLPKGGEK